MATPESKIKQHLRERIKALGGELRFAGWMGRKDCPDCRVMLRGKNCWAETKAPGEKPRPSQDREFDVMRRHGETVLELATTEDRIAAGRRFYNANVRALNTKVETFPANVVAGMFGFERAEYFEVTDPQIRQAPQVDFGV